MKKSLFLLIVILQFMSIGLFGYDNSQLEQLLAGETGLAGADFTNAILNNKTFEGVDFSGADFTGAKLVNVVFKKSKLDNAIFTEALVKRSNFINCTHKNMIILKTKVMSSKTKKDLKNKGALIVTGSIMCNSDTHVEPGKVNPKNKQKFVNNKLHQAKRMLNVAKKRDTLLKGIIHAGDLTDYGRKKNWDKFKKHFIVPFWRIIGRNKIFPCKGNHDRYDDNRGDEVGFLYKNPVTKEIDKYCKNLGSKTGDYYSYHYPSMNLNIVSLSECPTRNNNKPIDWLRKKAKKIKNMVVFSHYSPMHNIDWWSQGEYPRANKIFRGTKIRDKEETKAQRWFRKNIKKYTMTEDEALKKDKKNGRKAIKYFAKKIVKYKDKISIYVSGHIHRGFIKYWNGILNLGVGGDKWFAVLYFTSDGVLVSVELVEKKKVIRYYPKLFGLKKFISKR